ncbi:MAG: hypothetical protein ACKVQR_07510 [Aquabacterium sp.]
MKTTLSNRPASALASALATVAAVALLAAMTTGFATAGPPAAAGTATEQQRYDAARDQYEIGHFQVAFAEFATLADSGHCDATRMALQMLRYGKSLYATEFILPVERMQRWHIQPACREALARR